MSKINTSNKSSTETTSIIIILGGVLYAIWSGLIFTEIITYHKILNLFILHFSSLFSLETINKLSFYFIFIPVFILYSIIYYFFVKNNNETILYNCKQLLISLIALTVLLLPSYFIFSCWVNLSYCP